MTKLPLKISGTLERFHRQILSILENNISSSSVEDILKIQNQFKSCTDESYLSALSIGLPTDHIDRTIVLFSRIALIYQSGVLFENTDGEWKAQAYFHKGHVSTLKDKQKNIKIKLPQIQPLSVFKTQSEPLLKKLNLTHLDPYNHTQCLMLQPSSDFAFLIFSEMPDLWLKDLTEKVNVALQRSFCI